MEEKLKLGKLAILANLVLGGVIVFLLIGIVYLSFRSSMYVTNELNMYYAFLIGCLLLYGISLFWRDQWKVQFALITISVGVALFFAEIFLEVKHLYGREATEYHRLLVRG